MSNPLKGNKDALPEHLTPAGDVLAWTFHVRAIPIEKRPPIVLHVNVYASGALSVTGCIGDETFANGLLDHAIDAIRGYHQRLDKIVLKGRDTDLPVECEKVIIEGPVEDKLYGVACMESAKAAIKDMHQRRKATAGKRVMEL